ncbi:MAG: ClpXP protease specificity-enhancing factor [Halomonas sp.]|nr:ClpXP protease specificity-enhancing factor [Halomonas sp.]TVM08349.1 MAG: ClpXP protease specificity-enhancing factor [Halomonas sp.]
MHSSRPYLARALYEWLVDNELTPYLVVDATLPDVEVPRQFVQNGQIVLNVAPTAVRDLMIENDAISFNARFGGHPMQVMIPLPALIAIYARENGAGMVFGHEPELDAPDSKSEGPSVEGKRQEQDDDKDHNPTLSIAESSPPGDSNKQGRREARDTEKKDGKKSGKKPTLRVIK